MLNHSLAQQLLTHMVRHSLLSEHHYAFLMQSPCPFYALLHYQLVPQDQWYGLLSEMIGYPMIHLEHQRILPDLPSAYCRKHTCVLFDHHDQPALAAADPLNVTLKDEVRSIYPRLPVFLATPQNILYFLTLHDGGQTGDVVQDLIIQGLTHNASDIHFSPDTSAVQVGLRIDGTLQPHQMIPYTEWTRYLNQMKVRALLDVTETRAPQNGSFHGVFAGIALDCRISVHPTIYGEAVTLRLLRKDQKILHPDTLGFRPEHIQILRHILERPLGLLLISGPTGSGKTTTLYSLLSHIHDGSRKIMTLEEPVEYRMPGILQSEISNYADGIRSMLRQDPDVMLIGEIRDEHAAHMAVRASMTGHLVCATVHAYDIPSTLLRLQDLGVSRPSLDMHVSAVVSQRLVRKTCVYCDGNGCKICRNSGYHGRTVLYAIEDRRKKLTYTMEEHARWLVEQHRTTRAELDLHL